MRILIAITLAMTFPMIARGQATSSPSDAPDVRRGAFHIAFAESDPRSSTAAQTGRHHINVGEMEKYDLKKESFEVFVPPEYEPAESYGLVIWVNAMNRGGLPRGWGELMSKHKLIFISANESGNERAVNVRIGLALDAAANVPRLYSIDPARVYTGGISGGAKVACMLGLIYPEVFVGAIPVVGVSYFKNIPVGDDPMKVWGVTFTRPPTAVVERDMEIGRFVLITGPKDMNRDSIHDTYEKGFVPDGFKHVQYVEVPGMGHSLPPPEYIDRAIDTLDEPLPALAGRMLEMGQQLERSRKLPDARALYQGAALHGDAATATRASELLARLEHPPATIAPTSIAPAPTAPAGGAAATTHPAAGESRDAQARGLLSLAENYERSRLFSQAQERAQRIIREFADTPSAAGALELLRRIQAEQN